MKKTNGKDDKLKKSNRLPLFEKFVKESKGVMSDPKELATKLYNLLKSSKLDIYEFVRILADDETDFKGDDENMIGFLEEYLDYAWEQDVYDEDIKTLEKAILNGSVEGVSDWMVNLLKNP